jgi:hypothetical protein
VHGVLCDEGLWYDVSQYGLGTIEQNQFSLHVRDVVEAKLQEIEKVCR